jgi:hypothetical protein
MNSAYVTDGTHPNGAGHAAMTTAVEQSFVYNLILHGAVIPNNSTPSWDQTLAVGSTTARPWAVTGYNTTKSQIAVGDFNLMNYQLNGVYVFDNVQLTGSAFKIIHNGDEEGVLFVNGDIQMQGANSVTAGAALGGSTIFKANGNAQTVAMGGNISQTGGSFANAVAIVTPTDLKVDSPSNNTLLMDFNVPTENLYVQAENYTSGRGITSSQFGANGQPAIMSFKKSRGATIGTVGAVQNTDTIGVLFAASSDGTSSQTSAFLEFGVDSTVSTGSVPTSFTVGTGKSFATALPRFSISHTGAAIFNTYGLGNNTGTAAYGAAFTSTGNLIEVALGGMTNPMTTTGDMIYSSSGSTPARLGIGSNGNIMMVNSGLPSWQAQTQITSLGTIATGTWNGTGIGATYGGTGMTGFTAYGVFYANNSSAMTQTSVNSSSTPMTLQQVSGAAPAFSANGMVVASGNVTAQTAAYANVAQYAVPGSGGANTYRIGAYIKITAVVTDIIETQVTFTDEGGISQTLTFFPMGLTTATLSTAGFVGYPPMDIRVQQGSTIFVKTTLTVGTGTITYDLGGTITQLN